MEKEYTDKVSCTLVFPEDIMALHYYESKTESGIGRVECLLRNGTHFDLTHMPIDRYVSVVLMWNSLRIENPTNRFICLGSNVGPIIKKLEEAGQVLTCPHTSYEKLKEQKRLKDKK